MICNKQVVSLRTFGSTEPHYPDHIRSTAMGVAAVVEAEWPA